MHFKVIGFCLSVDEKRAFSIFSLYAAGLDICADAYASPEKCEISFESLCYFLEKVD